MNILKVISRVFTLALQTPAFTNVNFENVGQGDRVQHAPMQISASVKVTVRISAQVLSVSEILTLRIFDFENLGQGHRV